MNSLVPRFILNLMASSVQKDKDTIKSFIVPEVIRRRKLLADKGATSNNAQPAVSTTSDEAGEVDLLQYMLDVSAPPGEPVSPECIAQHSMFLIFASMVTTAGVLNHLLCDLAGRGDDVMPAKDILPAPASAVKRTIWECLHEEQVAAIRASNGLNEQALEKLPLLTAFICESLRMGSMKLQQSRACLKDGLLGGYVIEEGVIVFISGELAHKDPTCFPEPQTFQPLRFLSLTTGSTSTSGGSLDPASSESMGLFPFGIGRHVCVGRNFAMEELKMTVVVLMQQFRFRTKSGKVPAYKGEPSFCERMPEEVVFERLQDPLLM